MDRPSYRLRSLSSKSSSEQKVKDESIRDTLLDLANYAIIAVLEMDESVDNKIGLK